uniref:Glutaredoxin domain-containing protein n=1 Tax=Hucho hucho TaxID=62062 RepID=A0A4W5KU55_9TELE
MAEAFVSDRTKGDIDKVVLFLKPSCPYCVIANDVLSMYGFKCGHLEFINIYYTRDKIHKFYSSHDYLNKVTGAPKVSGRILLHFVIQQFLDLEEPIFVKVLYQPTLSPSQNGAYKNKIKIV